MAKKKKRNTSTFLKNHPDFFVFEQEKKEEPPINTKDSAFLDELWLLEYKWRDENNIFNHIY